MAKLDIAADSDSEGRGFESLRADHMKTPLESEPLRFGHQWCFCYKSCIYAAFQSRIFLLPFGLKKEKYAL